MTRDLRLYIEDILDSIAKVEQYTKVINEQDFLDETQVQDAVLRRFEIMGEAVKNIPNDFRDRYPDIPWKKHCRPERYTHTRVLRRESAPCLENGQSGYPRPQAQTSKSKRRP